ncbi:MAG: hypothetical protein K2W95_10390 [Candidatus Obscuribacterales bacterium]|nr:hypothetical protein [Candidatus Obscuribacterales bacterium]
MDDLNFENSLSQCKLNDLIRATSSTLLADAHDIIASAPVAHRKQVDNSNHARDRQDFLEIDHVFWPFKKDADNRLNEQKMDQKPVKSDKDRAHELQDIFKKGTWDDEVKKQVENIFRSCHSPLNVLKEFYEIEDDDQPFSLTFKPGRDLADPDIVTVTKQGAGSELQIRYEKQVEAGEGEYVGGGWKLKTKDGLDVQCNYEDPRYYQVKSGETTYKIEWSKEKDRYTLAVIDANGKKTEHVAAHSRLRGRYQSYHFPAVGVVVQEGCNGAWPVKIALPGDKELFIAEDFKKLDFRLRQPKN